MVQIDFSRIRGDLPDGRGAFEDLVCQLARRDAPSVDSFRRIEGAGGDGVVECLVKSSDGTVGYQAKFYTKSGEIDWTITFQVLRPSPSSSAAPHWSDATTSERANGSPRRPGECAAVRGRTPTACMAIMGYKPLD